MRFLLFALAGACALTAQSGKPFSFSVGAKIGAPLNDPPNQTGIFSTYTQSRWTGGPTVEFHLPWNFSIEADALARSYRTNRSGTFRLDPNATAYQFNVAEKTNVWDVPLLLKYRFKLGAVRPFVSAGYFWSHESTSGTSFQSCSGPQGSCRPADYPGPDPSLGSFDSSRVKRGPAAGAGVEFRTRYVTISPELRYMRPLNTYPRENRLTGIVGFTFGTKR